MPPVPLLQGPVVPHCCLVWGGACGLCRLYTSFLWLLEQGATHTSDGERENLFFCCSGVWKYGSGYQQGPAPSGVFREGLPGLTDLLEVPCVSGVLAKSL